MEIHGVPEVHDVAVVGLFRRHAVDFWSTRSARAGNHLEWQLPANYTLVRSHLQTLYVGTPGLSHGKP